MCYVPGIFFSIFNLFISQQTLKITPFINMLVVQMILLSSLLGLYLIIIYIIKYLGGVNFEKK